jgi:hypothetical protein
MTNTTQKLSATKAGSGNVPDNQSKAHLEYATEIFPPFGTRSDVKLHPDFPWAYPEEGFPGLTRDKEASVAEYRRRWQKKPGPLKAETIDSEDEQKSRKDLSFSGCFPEEALRLLYAHFLILPDYILPETTAAYIAKRRALMLSIKSEWDALIAEADEHKAKADELKSADVKPFTKERNRRDAEQEMQKEHGIRLRAHNLLVETVDRLEALRRETRMEEQFKIAEFGRRLHTMTITGSVEENTTYVGGSTRRDTYHWCAESFPELCERRIVIHNNKIYLVVITTKTLFEQKLRKYSHERGERTYQMRGVGYQKPVVSFLTSSSAQFNKEEIDWLAAHEAEAEEFLCAGDGE